MKAVRSHVPVLLFFVSVFVFEACSQNEVTSFWAGAIQPTSVHVVVRFATKTGRARLVVSTRPDLSNRIEGPIANANATNPRLVSLMINGLSPDTKYYYAVEADGKLDNSPEDIGSFRTPGDSTFSFSFTLGSCLNSNSHHPVFERMIEKQPLFFLQTGDFHYDNPDSRNANVHRRPYENLLSNPTYRKFFAHCPIAYVWDDHDYCGNNSDSTAAGKTNARIAYREYIPHYPFGTTITGNNAPIYQSFTIGRIHFIVTDLRSSRRKPTMMGAIQKQWFKDECVYAKQHQLMIAWVSSVSYGGNLPDNWGGFLQERNELANFFRDNDIRNMFILSGDAHMVAIDDGSHHDFSSGHNNPNRYPVLQGAALNESGSFKGGTYSGGSFPNPNDSYGQYGLVEVTDKADSTIRIKLTGFRVNSAGKESILTNYTFTRVLR
jgi:phosphodiesterase/alkaline phosphatase D-like protein